jgi:hypothetical protein
MVSHHSSGTGGFCQPAGSQLSGECVGTTSVPNGPSTRSSAATTAWAPPTTKPRLFIDECISTTSPSTIPIFRRSSASEAVVCGVVWSIRRMLLSGPQERRW